MTDERERIAKDIELIVAQSASFRLLDFGKTDCDELRLALNNYILSEISKAENKVEEEKKKAYLEGIIESGNKSLETSDTDMLHWYSEKLKELNELKNGDGAHQLDRNI